jgi:hypothetical protein
MNLTQIVKNGQRYRFIALSLYSCFTLLIRQHVYLKNPLDQKGSETLSQVHKHVDLSR